MCVGVMSSVFVQPGFVNRSSIAAAVCLRVDREPQPTPCERRGGTCARLREHHLKPSNSNRKIFPFHPSLLFIFFPPGWKKEQLQRRRCCSCKLLFSSAWVVSCCQRKNDKPQKKKKTRPIDSILTALLCFSSRQTVGCAAAPTLSSLLLLVTGTASPSFFFSFSYLPEIDNTETQLSGDTVSLVTLKQRIVFLQRKKLQAIIWANKSTLSFRGQPAFFRLLSGVGLAFLFVFSFIAREAPTSKSYFTLQLCWHGNSCTLMCGVFKATS